MATKKKTPAKASGKKATKKPGSWKEEAKDIADTITSPTLRGLAHQAIDRLDAERQGDVLGGCKPPPLPEGVMVLEGTSAEAAALLEKDDLMSGENVDPDQSPAPLSISEPEPEPQALTLPLLTDSGTLFIQSVQHLNAQLLGTDQSARLLVEVNGWMKKLEEVKKLIVGNDDAIEGLKKLVIEQGQPWGEKGSRQMHLAGVVVKVKAVNYRDPNQWQPTISDLDEKKVEAYLRGVPWDQPIEKVLACYMKPVTSWTLKDLPPQQQKNLQAVLADPGVDGQGLRQCLKDTKYQMMAPEVES